jgi:serine/threonine protein kinase
MGKLERQSSSIGRGAGAGSSGSSKFKWLLKTGGFGSGMSLLNLEKERIIGMGLMGTVRIAKLKDKNMYAALKGVRKDYIVKYKDGRHIENERRLMLQLNNPFCIKLFATFQDSSSVYFVMELAIGGELFRRLNKKDHFSPETTKFYVHEIFSALEHVQSLGWVYRDLKPENVMLDEDGHCKLVDFGFSTQPDDNGIVRTFCGTPAYLSPEQLNGKFTNGYSKIVDWWSLGILIFELSTGLTPFCNSNSETSYEIYLRILKNNIKFPRSFEATSKELVKSLCNGDIKKRLSDPDAIKVHPYFTMPWDAVNARRLVPPFVPRIKDDSDREHYFNPYDEPKNAPTDVGRLDLEGF